MTQDTTPAELEQALVAATAAAPALGAAEPAVRAGWIRAVADALDAAADELVPIAMRESSLPEARLRGEVARSTGQLRMFADVLEEGSLLEVVRTCGGCSCRSALCWCLPPATSRSRSASAAGTPHPRWLLGAR